ncbi:MAG: dockerin type I repeat-containing protein [Ruminococcus sp.]|nr:dockerin type I repeat-containing protein [Ruminococcus sp.]
MKKIKNILALLLALTIFATTCSFSVFAANDNDEVEIMPENKNVYEYGDVTMDLSLDITDATRISMYLVSMVKFNKTQKQLSDVNGDEQIDVKDVTCTQLIVARMMEHKYSDIIYLPIVPVV